MSRFILIFTLLFTGLAAQLFAAITGVSPHSSIKTRGENFRITLNYSGSDLSAVGEFLDISLVEVNSGLELFPVNVSILNPNTLEADFTLPFYTPIHENQNWDVKLTTFTNFTENYSIDYKVKDGVQLAFPSSIQMVSPTTKHLVDTSSTSQTFQMYFPDIDVNNFTGWKIYYGNSVEGKTLVNTPVVLGPNKIEFTANTIILKSEFINIYFENDAQALQVVPFALQVFDDYSPKVYHFTNTKANNFSYGFLELDTITVSMQNVDLGLEPVISVMLSNGYNNIYSTEIIPINSTSFKFIFKTENIQNSGPYRLRIDGGSYSQDYLNAISLKAPPKIFSLRNLNQSVDSVAFIHQNLELGLKILDINLLELDPMHFNIQLINEMNHDMMSVQNVDIISSDSMVLNFGEIFPSLIGVNELLIEHSAIPPIKKSKAVYVQDDLDAYVAQGKYDVASNELTLLFSQEIDPSLFVLGKNLGLRFGQFPDVTETALSLDWIQGHPSGQEFTKSLETPEKDLILNAWVSSGQGGRMAHDASLTTSVVTGKPVRALNFNEFKPFVVTPSPLTGPFLLSHYEFVDFDLATDTISFAFDTQGPVSFNIGTAGLLKLLVNKDGNGVDTLELSVTPSNSRIENTRVFVDASSISGSLFTILEGSPGGAYVELMLKPDMFYNQASTGTNVGVTQGSGNNYVNILNGPIQFSGGFLDLGTGRIEMNFSNELDTNYAKLKSMDLFFIQRNTVVDTFHLIIEDGVDWQNGGNQPHSMVGTIGSAKLIELQNKYTHGTRVVIGFLGDVFRSALNNSDFVDPISLTDQYTIGLHSDLPILDGVDLRNFDSELVLLFNQELSTFTPDSVTPISLTAYKTDTDFKILPIKKADVFETINYLEVSYALSQEIIDSITSFRGQGYQNFTLQFVGEYFESMSSNSLAKPLLQSAKFQVASDGNKNNMDLVIDAVIYDIVKNEIRIETNNNLDKSFVPGANFMMNILNPNTGENFTLPLGNNVRYSTTSSNKVNFTLDDNTAANLERTYGLLTDVRIAIPGGVVQDNIGQNAINSETDFQKLFFDDTKTDQNRLIKRVQFNKDTYQLQIYLNQEIDREQSGYFKNPLIALGAIQLSISKTYSDTMNIIANPDFLLLDPMSDVSVLDQDREIVFDLSQYKTVLDAWQTSFDDLFIHLNDGIFNVRDDDLGQFFPSLEALANVTVVNESSIAKVVGSRYDEENLTLEFDFVGQLAADKDFRDFSFISPLTNGAYEVYSVDTLMKGFNTTGNTLSFKLNKAPLVDSALMSGPLHAYVGPSAFVHSMGQGWNSAYYEELISEAQEVDTNLFYSINFQDELTNEIVPDDVVFSFESNFSDSIIGPNGPVKVVPGRAMYFRIKNKGGSSFKLSVPVRPEISSDMFKPGEVQVLKLDKNFEFQFGTTGVWERGDNREILWTKDLPQIQKRAPATSFAFLSKSVTLNPFDTYPVWNPQMQKQGTAIQVTWAPNLSSLIIPNLKYEVILTSSSQSDTIQSSKNVLEKWPLAVGDYTLSYKVLSLSNQLFKEDSMKFTIDNSVNYEFAFTSADHSNWFMLGQSNSTKPTFDLFSEGSSIYRWIDDAGFDDLFGKYVELQSGENYAVGEGFWLYDGSMQSLEFEALGDTVQSIQVASQFGEEGWVQISNPWSFPIPVSSVNSQGKSLRVWKWNPNVSDYEEETQKLLPGIGYFTQVKSADDIVLVARPWFGDAGVNLTAPSASNALLKSKLQNSGWNLNLSLEAGNKIAKGKTLGASLNGVFEEKELPSPMGERVSLSLNKSNRVDIQELGKREYHWNLTMSSNVSGVSQGKLKLDGLTQLKNNGYSVYWNPQGIWKSIQEENVVSLKAESQSIELIVTNKSLNLKDLNLSSVQLNSWPKLTDNLVTLDINLPISAETMSVDLVDSHGEIIYSKQYYVHSNRVQESLELVNEVGLTESGIYFLQVRSENHIVSNKITFVPR